MFSFLERLRRKMFRPVPRRKPPQAPRFVVPRLEVLEGRLVLDAMLFRGAGTPMAPALWNVVANWTDLTNAGNQHIPNASDDVGIPGQAGSVLLSGQNADVNSIVTGAGNILTTAPGIELKVNSNPPAVLPPEFPADPVAGANYFGGAIIDTGRINANTTNPYTGTNIDFAGGATIGPGDLNGNLVAGPNSTITFTASGEFLAGATFGQGSGTVAIAGPVTVDGDLNDQTATLAVVPGGTLGGTGSVTIVSNLNWSGGTISVADGVTVLSSGTLTTSGAGTKILSTALTNEAITNLGGAAMLFLNPGGSITNDDGAILNLSLPSITSMMGPASVTNEAGGTLNVTGSSVTLATPFTNSGNLDVPVGDALALTGSAITLDGTLGLDGFLYLYGSATSTTGFTLLHQSGFFEIGAPPGSGNPSGSLTVPAGVTDTVNGNLEVNGGSTLTGGGEISNGGRLQLDVGSITTGLGYYVQSNSGTLAEVVGPMMGYSPLTVTGTAQLSGILVLPGYVPVVGDSFTVVTATAGVADHFDSIPDGMTESNTATTATVTQVNPPA